MAAPVSRNHAYFNHRRQTYPLASPGNTICISGSLELDEARGSSVEPESWIFGSLKPDLARGSSGEPETYIFDSSEPDLPCGSSGEPELWVFG